jgi:peptidoglycan/LPS O-acetylase OafA/YrhL
MTPSASVPGHQVEKRTEASRWASLAGLLRGSVPGPPAAGTYRADVDGLRALAVLPVVFFHAGLPLFGGGFVGVDVFFVISGFLITTIIAQEIEQGTFTIARFYNRRIRRIFPALFLIVATCWLLGLVVFFPEDLLRFSWSAVATTLFTSNLYFWKTSDYFGAAASTKALLHTWSLAVEEQFYIFFPLFLVLLFRWSRPWRLMALAACLLISFGLNLWGVSHAPTATFYLAPSRTWELLLGALLALGVLPALQHRLWRETLAVLGLALLVYSVVGFSERTAFPGYNALVPCLAAALLIYLGASGPTLVGRGLSAPVLVAIGLISYSLYLWHWPLIVFAKYLSVRELWLWEKAMLIGLSLLLAYGSWKFVERPFRVGHIPFKGSKLFIAAGFIMTISVATGLLGVHTDGHAWRFPDFRPSPIPGPEAYNERTCFLQRSQSADQWKGDECFLTHGPDGVTLLWGDSFAAHYAPGFVSNAGALSGSVLQYTSAGCPPVFAFDRWYARHCKEFNRRALEVIERYDVRTIILAARWQLAFNRGGIGVEDIAAMVRSIKSKVDRIVVVGQSAIFPFTDPTRVAYLMQRAGQGGDLYYDSAVDPQLNRGINESLQGASFIDPMAMVCKGLKCPIMASGEFFVWDDGHLTASGSTAMVGKFLPMLK